jgi:hypothetical protein
MHPDLQDGKKKTNTAPRREIETKHRTNTIKTKPDEKKKKTGMKPKNM